MIPDVVMLMRLYPHVPHAHDVSTHVSVSLSVTNFLPDFNVDNLIIINP